MEPGQTVIPVSPAEPRARRRRRLRLLWYLTGIALLAIAVWAIWRQRGDLAGSWAALRAAPAWLLIAIVLLPLGNWLLSSAVYWRLTLRYGRVTGAEMAALIGSAWLFNLVPMRPGLLGRVAYHKAVNGIAVLDTAKVLVQVIACTAGTAGLLAGVCLLVAWLSTLPWLGESTLVGMAVFIGLAPAFVLTALASRGQSSEVPAEDQRAGTRAFLVASALRYLEMLLWTLRYWLVMHALGASPALWQLGIVVVASQVAGLLPVQLGVREWIVALMIGASTIGGLSVEQGLVVDLVNRAAEVACSLPVGLLGTQWLLRRVSRAGGPLAPGAAKVQ